jgi:hypothetical protein
MTNELEKQFFQCFGIEPRHKCTDGALETCDEQCNECGYYELRYPQITDRILLGIIAKIMWSYSCTQNDFDAYEVHTVDNLKEAVLKHAIELSKNDDYVYCGVHTLFEEG